MSLWVREIYTFISNIQEFILTHVSKSSNLSNKINYKINPNHWSYGCQNYLKKATLSYEIVVNPW
jgi:hypothetical protein